MSSHAVCSTGDIDTITKRFLSWGYISVSWEIHDPKTLINDRFNGDHLTIANHLLYCEFMLSAVLHPINRTDSRRAGF